MPKVSVIMTIYKRRFLKQSIDSVLAQTCRDFELVMVDDKSPEALYEVIQEYPWEKNYEVLPDGGRKWMVDGIPVRYYQNAEDIGEKDLVAALNHAIEYATSEWCVLASDDDVYDPEYLQEMLRLQAKYPGCDLFHSRIAVIDANNNWTRVGEERIEFETQIQMAYTRGVLGFWQTAQEYMFRLSAFKELGGFVNFPLAWYSDDATWMCLSRRGCACSSRIMFFFRQSGANISSNYASTVKKKALAADMFKKWFRAFSCTLKPIGEEDRFLITGIADKVERAVNGRTRTIIGKVKSLRDWREALRASMLPKRERRVCMYERWRWLSALRLLLPRKLIWHR